VYNVVNGACFTFEVTVGRPHPGPPTVALKVKKVPFATLYTWPPDDGLQTCLKHVEAL
jgi:hypothetical protein